MLNTLILALLSSILTNNLVLSHHLGLKSFFDVSDKGKLKPVIVTTIYVTIILVISTLIFYPIYYVLIVETKMTYLRTLMSGLVVLVVSLATMTLLKRILPEHLTVQDDQKVFITINSLLLGFSIISTLGSANYLLAIVQSLGSGIGFGIIGILFTLIRYRLEISPIPKHFKGLPIAIITAGLIAMAFLGFVGLV